ncbi:MAG: UDP-N-acetylmuramoyl-L-alanyl-D-glutamate--2,6-diaminopimelate ligase [Spongiibacteraceae bacterium]
MNSEINAAAESCVLGDLLPELAAEIAAIPVSGLVLDSRCVRAGDVFLAVAGDSTDGRDYIDMAFAAGAVAVVADAPLDPAQWPLPVIVVEQLAVRLSEIAGRFYGQPSHNMNVVGITGTNGKTSSAWIVAQLLEAVGQPCGLMGTLGNGRVAGLQSSINTTPDPLLTQSLLADWHDGGAKWAAMEVSSHGLVQNRVAAVRFAAAIFTNLSQDHLDFHGSMSAYGDEKARLFNWADLNVAVINRDDPFGRQLMLRTSAKKVVDYSLKDSAAAVFVDQVICNEKGISAVLHSDWGDVAIDSPLLGAFNLANLTAAVAALLALGLTAEKIEAAIPVMQAVPGRLECLRSSDGVLAVVDYAHTADALGKALEAVRALAIGDVYCIFGCGGNRDQGKRSAMGTAAERGADHIVVSNDNPRAESPEAIVDDICSGMLELPTIELDRERAIRNTIAAAKPGDVVLIAGKGHEQYQQFADETRSFSDTNVARMALTARGAK